MNVSDFRPDFEFLERVYDHIATHPEMWDQETWRCETGMCFAGTMAELHPRVEWVSDDPSDGYAFASVQVNSGFEQHVSDWATNAVFGGQLGTVECNEDTLFDDENTLADIRRCLDLLRREYGLEPRHVTAENTREDMAVKLAKKPENKLTEDRYKINNTSRAAMYLQTAREYRADALSSENTGAGHLRYVWYQALVYARAAMDIGARGGHRGRQYALAASDIADQAEAEHAAAQKRALRNKQRRARYAAKNRK